MSEPVPELDADEALHGVINQLVINGQRMPVIIPGSVIETLHLFAELLRMAEVAGYVPSLLPVAFPWARFLPETELPVFVSELAQAAESGERAPERLADLMREWRATAEVYADPAILSALRGPISDHGPVPEPSPAG
ncbi:MAG TPA: hypothetical protein VGI74_01660 [Streptosporangiaceae bacterium]